MSKKLLAIVTHHREDHSVSIQYLCGERAGETDTVEPGYQMLLYSSGCLIPISLAALLVTLVVGVIL